MHSNNALNKNSKEKNISNILAHKDIALQKLNKLLTIYANTPELTDKSDKLSYWIEDYSNYLSSEKDFKPEFLKRYHRGDVVKVNLGFRIGSEEGGLHYCVVVDRKNSIYSNVITVVPLTSDKGKTLHFAEVHLGNEIYKKFTDKFSDLKLSMAHNLNELASLDPTNIINETQIHSRITDTLTFCHTAYKINNELSKMKNGSIALVNQIITISKQRIYDPQHTGDLLDGIRISNESLDLINNKLKELFIK